MLHVSIFFGGVRVFFLCLKSNVTRINLFWWGPSFLSVSCVQCYPCLSVLVECVSSFCVLCPMFSVSIFFGGVRVFFLCLVPNVTRVFLFWWGRVFFPCLVSNVTRVYLFWWSVCLHSVSCAQCYPCISFLMGFVSSFCVLCLMIPVSIFRCLVSNVTRVYLFWWGSCLLSVSCVQCSPCLSCLVGFVSSFCVLCPMFSVSIFFGGVRVFFLHLVSNVLCVYLFWRGSCLLSVSCVQCYPCLSFLVE
jgi:hypothetical protein